MGHSQAEKAASRERILEAATRQIGERGLDSISISEIMKSARLTKGAFYAHFDSRDAMLAEAVERVMEKGQNKVAILFSNNRKPTLEQLVGIWLHPEHIKNPTDGCGICSLAGEARYAGPRVQQVIAEQFQKSVEQFEQVLGGNSPSIKDQARAILTAIVGAVNIARAVGDPDLACNVVTSTLTLISQASCRANV